MSVTLLTDDFNRANGAPGGAWANVANSTTIVSNALRGTVVADLNLITSTDVNPDTTNYFGPVDGKVTVIVKSLTGTGSYLGLSLRDGADGVDGVYAEWHSDNSIIIGQTAGGTPSTLDSDTVTFSTGDKFAVEYIGATVNVYINDVLILTGTTTRIRHGAFLLNLFPGAAVANVEIDSVIVETYTPYLVLLGTQQSGTGNISPAWPAGHKAGDYGLLPIESTGGQAANLGTPAGFSAVANSPSSTGTTTNGTRLTCYNKLATGSSEATPTVTDPGDHAYGRIIVFRGTDQTTPVNISGANQKASASTSFSISGVTTTRDKCLVLSISARDNDSAAAAYSAWTNAALVALTEYQDAGTTQNNGGGIGAAYGIKESQGATGATTGTVTSSINANMQIALQPPASGTAITAAFDGLVITELAASVKLSRVVAGSFDTLVISEQGATVRLARAVVAGLDTLAITEQAAVVRVLHDVPASFDTLTIAEQAAVITLAKAVAASFDALAITELAALVNAQVSISAGLDALLITELPATISTSTATDIAASFDALTITEQAAVVRVLRDIAAGLDTLQISEQPAVVTLSKAVLASFDALQISELAATVNARRVIAAGFDSLAISEQAAAVRLARAIAASFDSLLVTEQAATVRVGNVILATTDALVITEQAAAVSVAKSIAAQVDALLVTERVATVKVSNTISAAVDALLIVERQATLSLARHVSAGTDALAIVERQALVRLARHVEATTDALLIDERAAVVTLARAVVAGMDALLLTEHPATVEGVAAIIHRLAQRFVANAPQRHFRANAPETRFEAEATDSKFRLH